MDELNKHRQTIEQLQAEVKRLQAEAAELRKRNADLEQRAKGIAVEGVELPFVSEFEETLRRLVQRTAMIVQAEKCVIMVRDRESNELYARSPAFGMNDLEIKACRISTHKGISGHVFNSCTYYICNNTKADTLAQDESLQGLRIRNSVTVPLLIERRDDENRLIDRLTIGVLHCFNKRYGGEFNEEDVQLLERLSRNAAAVVANSQVYQEIIEEKEKLVHTLDSLTAGLILINQRGKIGQMNAQARLMFGIEEAENPLGKPFTEVIHHEQCLEVIQKQLAALSENTPAPEKEEEQKRPDEISIRDKDDLIYIYQVHPASVRGEDNQPIGTVFIFNDITDIRNVERMKTQFVSIVSHELRTPLTPMKGFIQTLRQDADEQWYSREDRQEFYGIIEQNVDRLSRLINDLLNVSRIEKGAGIEMHWDMIDVHKAVEDVVFVQKQRTNKHMLVVDFEPETIIAETDPDIIQNILHNVISNAIKYSPDGGEIRIIGRIEAATEDRPESILIGIKDQGLGLAPGDIKKIGSLFVIASHGNKGVKEGTGIGLYLVKNLVGAHNGVFWAESEGLGKGSTFWIRFPLKQGQIAETSTKPEGVTAK
jgi:two-component system phosphate regulon sensor histidine kinase PhoR